MKDMSHIQRIEEFYPFYVESYEVAAMFTTGMMTGNNNDAHIEARKCCIHASYYMEYLFKGANIDIRATSGEDDPWSDANMRKRVIEHIKKCNPPSNVQMYLCQVIRFLEALHPDHMCRKGFRNPHSYRGAYECLAFEPADNVSIGSMLAVAKRAVNQYFDGWKGGDFLMDEGTWCFISYVGSGDGIPITKDLLIEMTK